ncbi:MULTISPECIES: outer membrane protein [Sphingomonas]|uniref:Porin family protein n=1 Tax=Sphingomonas adhaesiva TaxID=28212 RepID=A0A2A4I7P0_9SPHN|nr:MULTISPECIES: outer membrane beta-barrel protein [Sphingomonas]PCG14611.1 porin family protein [Sphingomonas adhaesiva]PZU81763.1 MAG: porin family protein [Sphingomonas sp.]
MKIIALAAGAAAALVAPPAAAQEDAGFNGLYVGAAGGYDVQSNDRNSRILFDRNLDGRYGDVVRTGSGADAFGPGFCNGAARNQLSPANGGSCANDRDDWAYYGRVGLDAQRGRLVVGVVGEFGTTNITDSVTAFSGTPASYVFSRGIDWEAGIRARAGFTPNDTTLFYGTFGPGYARIDRAFGSTNMTNTFTGSGKRNQFGIQGGGGVEQRIGRFSIGLEYLYHQYRDDDYVVRAAGPAGTPFTNAANGGTTAGTDFRRSDEQFRWHSMRATVGFRF